METNKPTPKSGSDTIAQKYIVVIDGGSRCRRHSYPYPYLMMCGALRYFQRTQSETEGGQYSWTPHIDNATGFNLADARFWARFFRSAFLRVMAPPTRTEGKSP